MELYGNLNILWHCLSRKWQPTPVLLPGKSHGQRSLVDYSPWDHKESDTTEVKDLQIGRLSEIIQVGPKCYKCAYKRKAEGDLSHTDMGMGVRTERGRGHVKIGGRDWNHPATLISETSGLQKENPFLWF